MTNTEIVKKMMHLHLLIFLCHVCLSVEETNIQGTRGSDVSLKCLLNGTYTLPEWHGPPSYSIYHKQDKGAFNELVASISEGRVQWQPNKKDIFIRNVRKSDEGRYQCLYFGLGEYRLTLVVSEPSEIVRTGAVAAAVILLLWIIICSGGIYFIQTKHGKIKFLYQIGKHMKMSCKEPTTIALVLSCYIIIGWVILVYRVMSDRHTHSSEEDTEGAVQRTSDPLLQKNDNESEPQKDKTVAGASLVTIVESGVPQAAISEMPAEKNPLSDKDLEKISQNIKSGWELLAEVLNISPVKFEQIKKDQKKQLPRIYYMLASWRAAEGEKATRTSLFHKMHSVKGVKVDWNNLDKHFAPNAPTSVVGNAIDFSSIYVKWKAEHQDEDINYRVYYSSKKENHRNEITVHCKEATLTNLEHSTAYNIQVQAFNSRTESKLSLITEVITFNYAPVLPPELIQVEPVSCGSIFVKWNTPPDHNKHAKVKGYKLFYKAKGMAKQEIDVSGLETTLTCLEPSKEYTIMVQACNDGGCSEWSPPMIVKTFSYEIDAFETDPRMGNIYVDAMKRGTVFDRHLRVIIVGNSGHGKSSLARRLLEQSVHDVDNTQKITLYVNYCSKNDGDTWVPIIRSSKPEKKQQRDEKTFTVSILDFSDQFLFKSTYYLLHSKSAIYIVVFDLSKCNNTNADISKNKQTNGDEQDYISFWVNLILALLGRDENNPPIFFVGTHKDKIIHGKKELPPSYYEVNNIKMDDSVFKSLRKDVERKFMHSNRTGLPKHWIEFEEMIMEVHGDSILTFEIIRNLNKSSSIPLQNDEEIKACLLSCHHRGTLIYFNESSLSNFVIRNQDCLLNAFKLIVCSKSVDLGNVPQPLLDRLCQEGYLENELLDVLWGKNEYFIKHKEILVDFLQRYHMLTRVFHLTDNNTKKYYSFYVVPSLLNVRLSHKDLTTFENRRKKWQKRPMIDSNGKEASHKAFKEMINKTVKYSLISLAYVFHNETIVPIVYQCLTAVALGKWPVVEKNNKHLLCNHLGMYLVGQNHAGVVAMSKDIIELKLFKLHEKEIDGQFGDKFRRIMEMTIKQELAKFNKCERQYRLSVRCHDKCRGKDGGKQLYNYEDVKNAGIVRCRDADHEIEMEKALSEWYFNLRKVQNLALSQPLTEDVCSKLALTITGNWIKFATVRLQLDKGSVEQIAQEYVHSPAIQAFKFLLLWKDKHKYQTCSAAWTHLIDALSNCDYINIEWDNLKNILEGL